jgi:hypothetical protein
MLHLPGAVAFRASFWVCSCPCTRPSTNLAGFSSWDFDLSLHAGVGLFERNGGIISQVSSARYAASSSAAEEAIKDAIEAAKPESNVPENISEIDSPEDIIPRVSAIDSYVAKLIVLRSFFVV